MFGIELNFVLPHWLYWGGLLVFPLVCMALARAYPGEATAQPTSEAIEQIGAVRAKIEPPGNGFTRFADRISEFSGQFVAYWALIAVFVYFYEVVARYLFNSPTNWAHESMFLMCCMQYVLAGAYAYKHDSHVRVYLFYAKAGERGKRAIDIVTFIFFLAFVLGYMWTGWTFFSQSMSSERWFWADGYSDEVSFTEWAVAYWPAKFALFLSGVLLLIQGISRFIKDVQVFQILADEDGLPTGTPTWQPTSALGWVVAVLTTVLGFLLFWEVINVWLRDPWEPAIVFSIQSIMSGMDITSISIVMFTALMVLLFFGLPLAFVTGSLGMVFIYLIGDENMLNIAPTRIFPLMTNFQLSAIPLFIFMASMLERAGLIDDMFDVLYKWMGGLAGGLAIATVLASTILAAMVGVIGAAVVTMGIIALPAMLARRYDPQIALGSIMAGGTLGILIPPSILAIIYAVVAQESVGELYIGAVLPGLLLSSLYMLYVGLRSGFNPRLGPPLPMDERVELGEKLRLLTGMAAPVLLIVLVLGVIFSGAATPVEAAAIGSFGAIVVAALHGRLTIRAIKEASISTMKASAMVLWIIFGATIFVGFYILQGGQTFVSELILGTGLGPYGILILMMIVLVFLGMFLDWVGILLLAVPIFIPIVAALSFDGVFGLPGVAPDDVALWFGVLYLVNMQMSFLSPPFGYALFYMRGVAPKEISTGTIFRSALPFLALQTIGLTVCIVFPEIVLYLPRLVYG